MLLNDLHTYKAMIQLAGKNWQVPISPLQNFPIYGKCIDKYAETESFNCYVGCILQVLYLINL